MNCVRVHHIDKEDIWGERLAFNCDAFDAQQLDRMDYFIAQLRQRGIYINLNLHVSWRYRNTENFAYADYGVAHARIKGFDLFMDELIQMQKEYAQSLLTHVNPYTSLAYCDDPMLAMVEINNENGLTHRMMYKKMLDDLPPVVAEHLLVLWQNDLQSQAVTPIPQTLPTTASLKKNSEGLARYWVRFLYKIEKQYWEQMLAYIKTDCRVRVPVTGTQIDHTYPSLAETFDYVDRHLYWKHPSFPNNSWDWQDYYIKNYSMVPSERGTLSQIAMTRIANKPFVISEYNHPFPLTYAAEAITMSAVVSRMQDYDGLFVFHFSNDLEAQKVDFFSARFSHLKLSLFPFSAYLMRCDDFQPLASQIILPLGLQTQYAQARKALITRNPYLNMLYYQSVATQSLPLTALTQTRIGLQISNGLTDYPTDINALVTDFSDQRLIWKRNLPDYKQCEFLVNDSYAKVCIGWAGLASQYDMGTVQLKNIRSANGYFHFTCHNQTGAMGQAGRYIVNLQSQHLYLNVDYLNYQTGETLSIADDPYGLHIMARNVSNQTAEYVESLDAVMTLQLQQLPTAVTAVALDHQGIPLQTVVQCTVQGNIITLICDKAHQAITYVLNVEG